MKQNGQLDIGCRCIHNQARAPAVILEISNGVGGSEAMLFSEEMLAVYTKYFAVMKWPHTVMECDRGELGIRSVKLMISSSDAFKNLIQEAGVHRVQRIPKTERSGRMHTSTITVAVTPNSVLNVKLDERDVKLTSKRASGPGGQHVNKTESAVRLVHVPTGMAVESQESRSQIENKKTAMGKLLAKLREAELDRMTGQITMMRRSQVGNADRNEKIRTYNFPQDRVTDHRIGKSYQNLRAMIGGDVTILRRLIDDFHQS